MQTNFPSGQRAVSLLQQLLFLALLAAGPPLFIELVERSVGEKFGAAKAPVDAQRIVASAAAAQSIGLKFIDEEGRVEQSVVNLMIVVAEQDMDHLERRQLMLPDLSPTQIAEASRFLKVERDRLTFAY